MRGLRDTTCHRQLSRLPDSVGDVVGPVGDVVWPNDDGSAPASWIGVMLAGGDTTATIV
jgi:hypothetical protein